MKKMSGVVTALMTATDLCGNPDLEATLSMANYCREGCVDGLFVSGTNGEGANFSVSQRLKIAERILTQLDRSEMTVCIHTGASRLEETIALTRGAYELGADCAAIITPAFLPYRDEDLYRYFHAVSDSVPEDFSLYLYNIPPRTGNDIQPKLLEQLYLDCANIVGIKASFCNLERTLEYLCIEGISMLQGSDVFQLEYLAMNCDGVISGLSGVYPVPFVEVRKAWTEGDIVRARKWQKICYEICRVLNHGDVHTMKLALALKGLPIQLEHRWNIAAEQALKEKLEAIDQMIKENQVCCLRAV